MATMLAVQDTIAPLNIVDIGHERTCSCPPNHLNCMSAKEWIRAQLGVWQFNYNGRDIRNKNVHPATFPISLPTRVIELFTHRGQLVVDPFVGSGTTLLAARDTARNAVGFDLSEDYNELAKNRLGLDLSGPEATKQMAIVEDARNAASYFAKDSVSLIFTSPPYANLLNRPRLNKSRRIRQNTQYQKVEQYSQDSRDLGTLALDEYAREMGEIFQSLLPVLRPGGHCVINVPDMWWENQCITCQLRIPHSGNSRVTDWEARLW